ncbi:MAG: acyl-CoA dehydrogenase family protein [Vicinamibacterales bacterium]
MSSAAGPRGASWLFAPTAPGSTFAPERLTEEHRLIRKTADEFMANEVLPAIDHLDRKDWECARALVVKCGELGLLGTDVPEDYGGLAMDKVSSLIVGEAVGRLASFATTFGAQTGLTITPLLCFGTPEQKQKYLPRLVTGEILGAYALSESGSGSDALGARARAVTSADGSFLLSGEKMWITSGGFADIFIVFAKVDGEAFTAFIVERAFGGVTSGSEEHKLGLHGSSTTSLLLQDARVPAENVLGEIGKGHKVAFNVLNYGRFKLAAMCSGSARFIIGEAAAYASQRRQFGRSISEFGAVRHKLADMTIRQYAVESMLYRIAGLLDEALDGRHNSGSVLAALEEFAIEASIVKVAGSEMLDFVVDENVQIHGGNGFVRDYPAERHYRDARVNRIFEGTNEINRLLIPSMLLRRRPDLQTGREGGTTPLDAMKSAALLVLSTAASSYGTALGDQQDVLSWAADILIDVFATDSVLARALAAVDPLSHSLHRAAADVWVNDAAARVEVAARGALAAMLRGSELQTAASQLRESFNLPACNTVPRRHDIAAALLSRGAYPFA